MAFTKSFEPGPRGAGSGPRVGSRRGVRSAALKNNLKSSHLGDLHGLLCEERGLEFEGPESRNCRKLVLSLERVVRVELTSG